jgi:glycosyltransferase involved in cell wall biosynthesis
MTVSIVIPAYNEEKYIGDCLQSCVDHKPENLLEIIVVDNASTDATAAVAARYPYVRVVREEKKGTNAARHRGFLEARGDILVYLDADSRAGAGHFERMLAALSKPDVVCATGPYVFEDMAKWKQACVHFYWNVLAETTFAITKFMVVGGNFAAKRSAIEKMGGFDTSIAFYGDDTDIARRFHSVGKIDYSQRYTVVTSGRRLDAEGMVWTPFVYAMNYFWVATFGKPLNKKYKDFR